MLYGNDVATTHVVVYMLLYSSSTIDENNQSAHICMNHAKTLTTVKTQKLLRRIKDLGGRIFTTTSAVQAQKIYMFNAFSLAKNNARGTRFLLGFNMYLFLA